MSSVTLCQENEILNKNSFLVHASHLFIHAKL